MTAIFFNAAFTIYFQFIIDKLCLQHGNFTNIACLWSKDTVTASVQVNLSYILVLSRGNFSHTRGTNALIEWFEVEMLN
jgi:hypothetical protein